MKQLHLFWQHNHYGISSTFLPITVSLFPNIPQHVRSESVSQKGIIIEQQYTMDQIIHNALYYQDLPCSTRGYDPVVIGGMICLT